MASTHLLFFLAFAFVLVAHGHPTSLPFELTTRQQPRQTIYPVIQNPYIRAAQELLLDLRQQIMNRQMKFDEHFKNLLSSSKRSLHNLFVETYGVNYEQNTGIFTSMFEGLEQYYADGDVSITKFMEAFFEQLYQKIFKVYYSMTGEFSPAYTECVTSQLKYLKPFKDVPEKLINGIKHTFVAARTFNQALNLGVDIIKEIMKIGQPTKCTHLINDKLLFSTNLNRQNQSQKLPCFNFCEKIISSCTLVESNGSDNMIERWRKYVIALADLATKLSTSYNLETTIRPLDIQISEAIMNFQENSTEITKIVREHCGQPGSTEEVPNLHRVGVNHENRLARRAADSIHVVPAGHSLRPNQRNTAPIRTRTDSYVSSTSGQVDRVNLAPISRPMPFDDISPIARRSKDLIDEIKIYILSTKNFWYNLPSAVCTHNLTLGLNALKKQANCHQSNLSSVDLMNYDIRYRTEMNTQVDRLDEMRVKIGSALLGQEIDWSSGADARQTITYGPNHRPAPFNPTFTTTTTPEPEEDTDINCSDEENPDECDPDDEIDSDENSTPLPEDDDYNTTDSDDDTDGQGDLSDKGDEITENTSETPESNIVDRPPQPTDIMDNAIISVPDAQRSGYSPIRPLMSYTQSIALASVLTVAMLLL